MSNEFTFSITTTRFDEDYSPSEHSRTTTNFANLARGEHRQPNLRRTLAMINDRFNGLASRGNPGLDRYAVELEIVSAELQFSSDGADHRLPLIEVLDIQIVDRLTGARFPGIVGNNFSSYVRDFDFSVRLLKQSTRAPLSSPCPATSVTCTANCSNISSTPRPTGSASRWIP